MTNTISGSLGKSGGGATVFFTEQTSGFNSQQGAPVIADVNGNFTSPPLASSATYKVIPCLFGAEFSPFSQTVVLGTSNVTGINWSAALSYYNLVQHNFDSFNRGGVTQNPLTGWTAFSIDTALQSVNNTCQPTTINSINVSGAYATGYTPTADCYAQVQLHQITSSQDLMVLKVRQNTTPNQIGFQLEFYGQTGVAANAAFQLIDIVSPSGAMYSGPNFADAQNPVNTLNSGDVILLVIRGGNVYAFQNFTPVGAGGTSANTPGAGFSGMELNADLVTTEIQLINWAAGNVLAGQGAYSVPDDRNYATFPNAARNIQGTQIYDVSAHPSHATTTDSRASGAPLDSRAAAIIPENSRTPGTYGPGE